MGHLPLADDVPLRDTTFVVVDLETTGGRANATEPDGSDYDAITEIGAVKVRGGEVLGELATLVDPGRSIPPQIVALTGITSAMVCNAPTIDSVLPAFLEFSRGAVLVAHNAGFDIGFLRAAAERCQIAWPRPPVLCTVRLARRVLTRDEAPSVRLAALARLFGAATTPTHRALDDARATVDVLHGLIERVGNQGVHTYTDLRSYLPDVTPAQRRKRHLADPLPHRPGVYLFRGPGGRGALRRHRGGSAAAGQPVLHRRRPANPHQGDGVAGHRASTTSSARTTWRPGCASCGCWPRTRRPTTGGPSFRTGGGGWCSPTKPFRGFPRCEHPKRVHARSDRSALAPTRSKPPTLLARFTGVRTCTTRLARSALHGPACRERELSPCPAGRGITAAEYAAAPRRAAELIDGQNSGALSAVLAHITEPRRGQPLRDRRAAARSRRRRDRRAVEGSAAARAGVGHRTGGGAPGR